MNEEIQAPVVPVAHPVPVADPVVHVAHPVEVADPFVHVARPVAQDVHLEAHVVHEAPDAHPGVLASTGHAIAAYATAFRDNAAASLEAVGHIAKLPIDHNFTTAASAELEGLDAEATARGVVADMEAEKAVDDLKANFGK